MHGQLVPLAPLASGSVFGLTFSGQGDGNERGRERRTGRRTEETDADHVAGQVLIVEDHMDTRHIYRAILAHGGFGVIEAADGQEAVRLARQQLPDIILMDINLPILNGWEATRLIKEDERTRAIPVVVISASASEESYRRAQSLGCEGYHTKPFSPLHVLAEVQRVLGFGEDS